MRDHLPALSRCSMPFQHEAKHLLQYSIRCSDCVNGAGEQLGLRAKWKRIWDEHPALENLYLQRREAQSVLRRLGAAPNEASDCTKGASVIPDRLQTLSTDLCMLARNSKFEVCISTALAILLLRHLYPSFAGPLHRLHVCSSLDTGSHVP